MFEIHLGVPVDTRDSPQCPLGACNRMLLFL